MEQKKMPSELENDQLLAEQLFTKDAFKEYAFSASNVPESYFDQFPEKLQKRISNNKPKLFFLTPIGKMAIAAGFMIVVAGTFIFLNTSVTKKSVMAGISIQDIPSEEMEAYVDANEWMADIDWHTEAFKSDTELELLYKDSIN